MIGFQRPRAAMGSVTALAPSLSGEAMVLREAALFGIDALSSLSPRLGSKFRILGKTSLLVGYAFPAFTRNGAPPFQIHGSKATR